MRSAQLAIGLLAFSISAMATETDDNRHYKVVDEHGNTYHGVGIPPELSDYYNIEEIEVRRERRIELFQASSRVIEVRVRYLEQELEKLWLEASHYAPEPIEQSLLDAIQQTKDEILRLQLHRQKLPQQFGLDAESVD